MAENSEVLVGVGAVCPHECCTMGKKASSTKTMPFFWAVCLQVGMLLLTVYIVVHVKADREEPHFVAKKTIYLPEQEQEHRVAVEEFFQAADPYKRVDKLTVDALLPESLPKLPELPPAEFDLFADQLFSMDRNMAVEMANLAAAGGEMGERASTVSILGISDEAERFVIAFDISRSVVNNMKKSGMDILKIKEETAGMITGLNANTLFGLIQFSRGYDLFSEYLVAGTQGNKKSALDWLEKEFRTSGSSGRNWTRGKPDGIQSVLEAVFRLEPDVVFLLSDASFQRTPEGRGGSENIPWTELEREIKKRQDALLEDARLHFIGFGVSDENGKAMKALVRRYRGKFKAF